MSSLPTLLAHYTKPMGIEHTRVGWMFCMSDGKPSTRPCCPPTAAQPPATKQWQCIMTTIRVALSTPSIAFKRKCKVNTGYRNLWSCSCSVSSGIINCLWCTLCTSWYKEPDRLQGSNTIRSGQGGNLQLLA
ncbi:hypothetical protein ACQJBY_017677 [Aegilops geniculata]